MAAYTNWTDEEVFQLIQVWSEESMQEHLEGAKRNKTFMNNWQKS